VAAYDRRVRQCHVQLAAVLAPPHGLVPLDPHAGMDAPEQLLELPRLSLREEDLDRLANGLLAGVAVEPLGARVPACYEAVRALADDRVARGLDDGRELAQGILGPL